MGALDRKDILAAKAFEVRRVEVPEWNGYVHVRSLSAAERDELEASMITFVGKRQQLRLENFTTKLFTLSVCDEKGARLFSEADIPALSKKSAVALRRVVEAAQLLAGMTAEDVTKLTEGLKNDQPEGSHTA